MRFLGFHNEGFWTRSSVCYTAHGSHWNDIVFRVVTQHRVHTGGWDWGAGNGSGKRDKGKPRKTGMMKQET
jgi:hypothetical protein